MKQNKLQIIYNKKSQAKIVFLEVAIFNQFVGFLRTRKEKTLLLGNILFVIFNWKTQDLADFALFKNTQLAFTQKYLF